MPSSRRGGNGPGCGQRTWAPFPRAGLLPAITSLAFFVWAPAPIEALVCPLLPSYVYGVVGFPLYHREKQLASRGGRLMMSRQSNCAEEERERERRENSNAQLSLVLISASCSLYMSEKRGWGRKRALS